MLVVACTWLDVDYHILFVVIVGWLLLCVLVFVVVRCCWFVVRRCVFVFGVRCCCSLFFWSLLSGMCCLMYVVGVCCVSLSCV